MDHDPTATAFPLIENRRDVYLPGESPSLVICSDGRAGHSIEELDLENGAGWESWERAVDKGVFLPFALYASGPLVIRIVLGALDGAEEAQWVGSVRWNVDVPNGRLALCPGFDYLEHPCSEPEREFDVRFVDVPAGEYRVTVYSLLSGVNGEWCGRRSDEPEAPGAWFRRVSPGQEFPDWLQLACASLPELDPGHEEHWDRFFNTPDCDAISDRFEARPHVDLIVQLETLEEGSAGELTRPELDDGLMHESELRKPDGFPMGLPAAYPEEPQTADAAVTAQWKEDGGQGPAAEERELTWGEEIRGVLRNVWRLWFRRKDG
jgi:hypothetical protein